VTVTSVESTVVAVHEGNPMNHHLIVSEMLARGRIEDLRREAETARLVGAAQINRKRRASRRARKWHPIRHRKASLAC